MKKWISSAVLLVTMGAPATAQTMIPALIPDRPLSSGELSQDTDKAIPNGRIVLPRGLEVTFEGTMHLVFPAPVRYVDLGSQNIITGKAEDAESVLYVKAAVKNLETETSMSVICEDSSFYAFNVKCVNGPEKLSVGMKDSLSPVEGHLPSNRADIYFREPGSKSPMLAKLMMQTICQNDERTIKHIRVRQLGMKSLLRELCAHNGLLYFYTQMENGTNIPYSMDFAAFKAVDKEVVRRTAIQEQVLQLLRAYHQVLQVRGEGSEHSIFILDQFSLSEDKQLEVTFYECNGGWTLTFYVEQEDLLLAQKVDNLKPKR